MYRSLLLLLILPLAGAAEKTFEARGLKISSFGEQGQLIRQIRSETATGPLEAPVNKNGRVDFFKSGETPDALGVITWTEAIYRKREERIIGNEHVTFSAQGATLEGKGVQCDLASGRLDLLSEVTASFEKFRINGDKALIVLDPKVKDSRGLVRFAEISGRVVIIPPASADYPFEKAQAPLVKYNAAEHTLLLKSPVTLWKEGKSELVETTDSEFFEINLGVKTP
ncbi:MAG TPA: hypothetical protein PLN52_09305 [Opitutaceae bacterium]|nr:hypothetical protein [Opitutaceae bacterium]